MGPCFGNNSVDQSKKIKNIKLEISGHHLTVQQKIASGAYGDIWKCKDIKTGELMAAKQVKLQNQQLSEMYKKEVRWLQKFNGTAGVVKYIGSRIVDDQEINKGRNGIQIGIILTQFYEISLFDMLKNKKFNAFQVLDFLTQILRALKTIHASGCLHLDLKMENILCSRDQDRMCYHICDFGSSVDGEIKVSGLDKRQKNKLKQFIESNSTQIYRAPQMIELTSAPITKKADIWMLGCVLHMLLFRKHQFEGQGLLAIITPNTNFNAKLQLASNQTEKQKKIAQKLLNCLKGMLQVKIQDRLGQDQLLQLLSV